MVVVGGPVSRQGYYSLYYTVRNVPTSSVVSGSGSGIVVVVVVVVVV